MTKRSRILIADDHNLMAELCKRLLETEFDVVGIDSDGDSAGPRRRLRAKSSAGQQAQPG